jgi:DNA repair protein RecN (Recombination protein N)
MLNYLQIDNYALIEHSEVEFSPGFNVITGESGAGKSIMLGALAFLSGERTPATVLRSGSSRCSVSAIFTIPPALQEAVRQLLEDSGIEYNSETDELALRRILTSSGTRQFANDQPCSAKLLTLLAANLIDRQKVNEQLSLQQPARQLELLDRCAGTVELRNGCATLYARLREIRSEQQRFLETLPGDAEADRLKLMLDEINAVNPEPGEDETLAEKFRMASNAREIIGISEGLVQLLSESENSITDILGTVFRKLDELQRLGAASGELLSECTVVQEGVEHLARELSDLASQVELDPEELARIESRMGEIFTLKRRYGPSLEELFANRAKAEEELARYNAAASTAAEFEKKIAAINTELQKLCQELSLKRKEAVKGFLEQIAAKLNFLGFGKCRFETEFTPCEPGPTGADRFEMLFSANAGSEVQPLRKIASSGELSRLMLGLKTVLADADDVPTVIFDEIDMNIGGETANAVGEELHNLGQSRQIISISHLAQVAARADRHFKVSKAAVEGRVRSGVEQLRDPGEEIARMLGNTPAARKHADELLKELRNKKR